MISVISGESGLLFASIRAIRGQDFILSVAIATGTLLHSSKGPTERNGEKRLTRYIKTEINAQPIFEQRRLFFISSSDGDLNGLPEEVKEEF